MRISEHSDYNSEDSLTMKDIVIRVSIVRSALWCLQNPQVSHGGHRNRQQNDNCTGLYPLSRSHRFEAFSDTVGARRLKTNESCSQLLDHGCVGPYGAPIWFTHMGHYYHKNAWVNIWAHSFIAQRQWSKSAPFLCAAPCASPKELPDADGSTRSTKATKGSWQDLPKQQLVV